MELQLRRAAVPDHLDVAPQNALRVAGAERFHGGFLGGKARGEMGRRHPAPRAVGNLAVGEDPAHKPVAVAFDDVGDPSDIRRVESDSDDGHYLYVAGAPPPRPATARSSA